MNSQAAEAVALSALGWIAADEERVGAFLGAAGASPSDLRVRAREPEFLGFVLDFLLADEDALLAFCAEANLPPEAPFRARHVLPGGDAPHWT